MFQNISCVWCLENVHFCLAYTDIGGVAPKALVFTRNKENMARGKRIFISTYEDESIIIRNEVAFVFLSAALSFSRA